MTGSREVWAAFDFDGTLTRRDTLLPFLHYSMGAVRFLKSLVAESPSLAGYAAGIVPNDRAKERLLERCFSGEAADHLREYGRRFAIERIPLLLRPNTMARMREHLTAGHVCVVVSASPGIYIRPWAEVAGVHRVICTELETDHFGRVTGRLAGGNCYGAEKARRLTAILPPSAELHAYGDSCGDREMLAMADYGYYRGRLILS